MNLIHASSLCAHELNRTFFFLIINNRACVHAFARARTCLREVVVDMRLTVMKEIGARLLVSTYDYFQSRSEICRNGFVKAGIVDAISNPDNIAPASRDDCNDGSFSDLDNNDEEDRVINSD